MKSFNIIHRLKIVFVIYVYILKRIYAYSCLFMCVYLLTMFLLHDILALHILLLSEGVNLSTPTALPTKGRSNKSDLWFLRWVQKTMQCEIVEAPLKIKLHPWSLTWNLKISPWKRRFLLETIILRFHVKVWGCKGVALYTCHFCCDLFLVGKRVKTWKVTPGKTHKLYYMWPLAQSGHFESIATCVFVFIAVLYDLFVVLFVFLCIIFISWVLE